MSFNIGAKPHNICRKEMSDFLESFFSLGDWEGLYLTGGTALAEFYLAHRISVDIDFFTTSEELFLAAANTLKDTKIWKNYRIEILRSFPRFVSGLIHPKHDVEPIKIDLVWDIPVRLHPPVKVGKIWVDDIEDIAANKITCLLSREQIKDYVDMYFLAQLGGWTLREWIEAGKKKDGGLAPFILSSCINKVFEFRTPPDFLRKSVDWNHFQSFWKQFQDDLLAMEPRPEGF